MSSIQKGWIVTFASVAFPFATYAQAKRFVKNGKKEIEDVRRGAFKAVIVRAPIIIVGSGGAN